MLRSKFTKWYVRKGWTMEWAPCDYGDGVSSLLFDCPFWVRPFVYFLFSPAVYYCEYMPSLKGEKE